MGLEVGFLRRYQGIREGVEALNSSGPSSASSSISIIVWSLFGGLVLGLHSTEAFWVPRPSSYLFVFVSPLALVGELSVVYIVLFLFMCLVPSFVIKRGSFSAFRLLSLLLFSILLSALSAPKLLVLPTLSCRNGDERLFLDISYWRLFKQSASSMFETALIPVTALTSREVSARYCFFVRSGRFLSFRGQVL